MAGNSLDELFVTIGLKGAKNATQDLFKFEKSLDVTQKQAETLVDILDKLQGSQKKVGKETKKSGNEAKKSSGFWMSLGKSAKFAWKWFKKALKTMRKTWGLMKKMTRMRGISDILKIAGGVSLGNAISRIPGMITGAIGQGIDITADEEQARRQATKGLITGQVDTPANQNLIQRTAVELRTQFSIPLAQTFKSFGKVVSRSNNDIKKIQRIISLSAVMKSKVGSKVDFDTLVRQLDLFTRGGELEESLREAAPFLKEFRDSGQDRNKALDVIANEFKFLPRENFQTYEKALERLEVLFGEGTKSFFRPVINAMTDVFNIISEQLKLLPGGILSGKTPGEAVAAGIRSLIPSAETVGSILESIQKFLKGDFSKILKIPFVIAEDLTKFFKGERSAFGLSMNPTGKLSKGDAILKALGQVIGKVVSEAISFLLGAFREDSAIRTLFSKMAVIFASAFGEVLKNILNPWFLKGESEEILDSPSVNKEQIAILKSLTAKSLLDKDFDLMKSLKGFFQGHAFTFDPKELQKELDNRIQLQEQRRNAPTTNPLSPIGPAEQEPMLGPSQRHRDRIEDSIGKLFGVTMNNDIKIVTNQAAQALGGQLTAQLNMLSSAGRLA